jgi:60 kDa SS-A/Ro ribonucleoprotein
MAIEFMRAGVKNAFTLYLLMIISVQPRRKTVGTLAAIRVRELNERTTMANKTLFQSLRGALVPKTDSVNEAGGGAYELSPKQALAQYALTGCLNSTYYASADDQLLNVLALAEKVDADFVAKTAVYARQKGFMKDMPALLCASLSTKDPQLLRAVFDRVINDGKMLRNFVQVLRSGVTGRKSLGTVPKKLAQRWLESRSDEQLFRASVGNDPSLADLIKMVHPKPGNPSRDGALRLLARTQTQRRGLA